MNDSIKLLVLDDRPADTYAAIMDGLKSYDPSVSKPRKRKNGFDCTMPAKSGRPDFSIEVFTNEPKSDTPKQALEDARALAKDRRFNGILVDDAWGDTTDTSGHSVVLERLLKMPEFSGNQSLSIAMFSQHFAGTNDAPRDASVEAKMHDALPGTWSRRVRMFRKNSKEEFKDWFSEIVRTRPKEAVEIEVRQDENFAIYFNGVVADTNDLAKYPHAVLGYLDLVAAREAEGKPSDLAPKIVERYKAGLKATGSLATKMSTHIKDTSKRASWECSNQEVSAVVDQLKKVIISRKLLTDQRLAELSSLGQGAGAKRNNTRLFAGFLTVRLC